MRLKKSLLSRVLQTESFLINKKLASFLVLISLSVNGFAPSTVEVSRYSLVMVAATVARTAVIDIFKKCDKSLVFLSESFYRKFFNVLRDTPLKTLETSAQSKAAESSAPSGAGEISIKQAALNEKIEIAKENGWKYSFMSAVFYDKAPPARMSAGVFAFSGGVIIILFLLFILRVIRRKDSHEDIIIINGIIKRFSV